MRILLIDNHTEHKRSLHEALKGHKVEVQTYRPGLKFNTEGKDLVILSGGGGEGREIDDSIKAGHLWYEDELSFVKSCDKPILGICMGFEVICRAYGSKVEEMSKEVRGPAHLKVTRNGRKLLDHKKIHQYEAHKWRVKKTPKGFKALAKSSTGVEIIKHKKKPILATQFHPELGGTTKLNGLIKLAVTT
ncbi:gamma-glutamyl-gamma-aminobutyrate hydrolase family protein [Candidatus Saccharibacteria bacterium]|nr:gamma-glutamyl-gamma-aminobutyrate hydrolase family protein [Candidatus Saccharibacteria bacterium]